MNRSETQDTLRGRTEPPHVMVIIIIIIIIITSTDYLDP